MAGTLKDGVGTAAYEETMNGLGIEEADEEFVAALKKDKQG
jgi:hypothetical protein